jgi:hypothetical protein
MARRRATTTFTIVILTVTCLCSAAGVKAHAEAASLNEITRQHDEIVPETPFTRPSKNGSDELPVHDHPHTMHGKPTKFDIDLQSTDERADDQIETTRAANVTVNPVEADSASGQMSSPTNATGCRDARMFHCIRKDLLNFLDQLASMDTYNVTESVQIVRNPEADKEDDREDRGTSKKASFLDKVHRYARTHMMKIQLNKDSSLARKARTFFGCESPDRLHGFLCRVCTSAPLSSRGDP